MLPKINEVIILTENKIDLEKSLSELENIISKLEASDTTLEASIELFEKGIKHITECKTALENAQNKIISLTEAEKEN